MVYEPLLRIVSREARRTPTVPMLLDGSRVARDSLEIARYADERGTGEKLIPSDHEGAVIAWNDHAERLMQNARARVVGRLLVSPSAALVDELPSFLQRFGVALAPVARLGLGFIAHKFDTKTVSLASSEAVMTQVLELATTALERSDYLVDGRFTLADLSLACALGFVEPHTSTRLGPESRQVWREPALAAAFPSLVRWRDRIVARHR
mgnify:CR=1 FL=1